MFITNNSFNDSIKAIDAVRTSANANNKEEPLDMDGPSHRKKFPSYDFFLSALRSWKSLTHHQPVKISNMSKTGDIKKVNTPLQKKGQFTGDPGVHFH